MASNKKKENVKETEAFDLKNVSVDFLTNFVNSNHNTADFIVKDGYKIAKYTINNKIIYNKFINNSIIWKLLEQIRVEISVLLPEIEFQKIDLENMSSIGDILIKVLRFSPEKIEMVLSTLLKRLFIIKDDKEIEYSEANEYHFFEDPYEIYELLYLFIKLYMGKPFALRISTLNTTFQGKTFHSIKQ